MSFDTMITEMTFFGVFLIAGFLLREIVKPIQKLFIPSSIIGGVIALVGGQQILGLWEVPSSFGSYSGTLIRFVMCALIFGVTLNLEKLKSYADYMWWFTRSMAGKWRLASHWGRSCASSGPACRLDGGSRAFRAFTEGTARPVQRCSF